jgi:cell division protein FtsQ
VITSEHLERFPGLLQVVGEGADKAAAALIAMLDGEPDLEKRVTAAVRVGERRWNLAFEGGITVELPEENAAEAWAHLAEIERDHALLARDVVMVDLRLADRVVVTPAAEPAKAPASHAKPAAKPT